jgi:hypothetical protein
MVMMGSEMIPAASVFFNQLTQLILLILAMVKASYLT